MHAVVFVLPGLLFVLGFALLVAWTVVVILCFALVAIRTLLFFRLVVLHFSILLFDSMGWKKYAQNRRDLFAVLRNAVADLLQQLLKEHGKLPYGQHGDGKGHR